MEEQSPEVAQIPTRGTSQREEAQPLQGVCEEQVTDTEGKLERERRLEHKNIISSKKNI